MYALLDGKKLIAGVVFLLNLAPFATNLVCHISQIIPEYGLTVWAQWGDVIATIVMDDTRCTTIEPASEALTLRWVYIGENILQ